MPKVALAALLSLRLATPAAAQTNAAQTNAAAAPAPTPPGNSIPTRWASNVSAANALPEYPRPQMVRSQWQNLNGSWQFAIAASADEAAPVGRDLNDSILVPFAPESRLSGVHKMVERAWYRRTFSVPNTWTNERVLLHFGAVDWEANVWVNGQKVGAHRGGFDRFSFDITDALRADGPQELIVGIFDPSDGGSQPRGKQVKKPGGIMYTPVSGIWQTVWMEAVPQTSIQNLKITPDVDSKVLWVQPQIAGAGDVRVRAVASIDGRTVGRVEGAAQTPLKLPIRRPRLWSPDNPFLYDLRVELWRGKTLLDGVDSYFAMRKIERKSDGRVQRLMLNGKFLFQVGLLDQGYWPDGLYTAPTDAALRWDIETAKKMGFNLLRKHAKVEPSRWYYHADKLGMLVWQDMPSGDNANDEAKKQYEEELRRLVEGMGNHPSILMWVVFNEGWGQFDTERLTALVKNLDPSRLVSNASGWVDKGVGDIIDMHKYPDPGSPKPEANRAAVLGEFGGLGLPVKDHMWSGNSWGYQGMADADQLTRRYVRMMRQAYKLKESGLNATVYTQLTDVEVEANGLLSYDRAVIKPDAAAVVAANRGQFSPEAPTLILAPIARDTPVDWRYSFDNPGDNWQAADFDDSSWKSAPGGFGQGIVGVGVIRTPWTSPDIWMRREFSLNTLPTNPRVLVHHDEDADVYINGVLAARVAGFTGDWDEVSLSPEALAALKIGRNVLALHVRQTGGGQYADAGLIGDGPMPKR